MGMIAFLFGRRKRKATDALRDQVVTLATLLTLFRASASSAVFVVAIVNRSRGELLVGLGISMCLDFLDGIVARWKRDETILGAQLDGLADRLAAYFVVVGSLAIDSSGANVAIATVVWFQFGVVDQLFSTQFLRFGLWSPDHFYAIDDTVWRFNWSPLAKLASNLPIAAVAIGGATAWIGVGLAVIVVALRLWTYGLIREKAIDLVPELRLAQPVGADSPTEAVSRRKFVRPRRAGVVELKSLPTRAQRPSDADRSPGRVSA